MTGERLTPPHGSFTRLDSFFSGQSTAIGCAPNQVNFQSASPDLRAVSSAVTVLGTLPGDFMIQDDPNSSGTAPARVPVNDASNDLPEGPPPLILDVVAPTRENLPVPPAPLLARQQFDASVPEDLRTPWGWRELLLFIGFGLLGMLVAAGIVLGIAVLTFHVPISELNQSSMTPAKSTIAILAQGVWSGFVLI